LAVCFLSCTFVSPFDKCANDFLYTHIRKC